MQVNLRTRGEYAEMAVETQVNSTLPFCFLSFGKPCNWRQKKRWRWWDLVLDALESRVGCVGRVLQVVGCLQTVLLRSSPDVTQRTEVVHTTPFPFPNSLMVEAQARYVQDTGVSMSLLYFVRASWKCSHCLAKPSDPGHQAFAAVLEMPVTFLKLHLLSGPMESINYLKVNPFLHFQGLQWSWYKITCCFAIFVGVWNTHFSREIFWRFLEWFLLIWRILLLESALQRECS